MTAPRTRREPPTFRAVELRARHQLGPCLVSLTLGGEQLAGFDPGLPAASVRVLLPDPLTGMLSELQWNGNEFLRPDRTRPPIRTLTPLRFDPERLELDVEVVLHDGGRLPRWATDAELGSSAAVSGTGRGYEIPSEDAPLLLAGDASAVPAIGTIVAALPATTDLQVVIATQRRECRVDPDGRLGPDPLWCASLLEGIRAARVDRRTHLWAAGEAAEVQRVRRHLFDDLGLARSQTHVRGYWKAGREGTG